MDQQTHQIRLTKWASLIKDCSDSGLTKTAWCEQNNVSIKSFYYWQRRLRTIAAGNAGIVPEKNTKQDKHSIIELPASVNHTLHSSASVILHINDISLEISNNATPELLNTILKVIAHAQ